MSRFLPSDDTREEGYCVAAILSAASGTVRCSPNLNFTSESLFPTFAISYRELGYFFNPGLSSEALSTLKDVEALSLLAAVFLCIFA